MGRPRIDIIGKKHGRWTPLSFNPKGTALARASWTCKCECGTITPVDSASLYCGTSQSCGCLSSEVTAERNQPKVNLIGWRCNQLVVLRHLRGKKFAPGGLECQCDCGRVCKVSTTVFRRGKQISCGHHQDLTGQRFGRWVVLRRSVRMDELLWVCRCSCEAATVKEVRPQPLRRGYSQSCGCIRRERVAADQFRRREVWDEAFEAIDTEEKAYWLGFIAADGCVCKNNVMLGLATVDADHVELFRRFLKTNYLIIHRPPESKVRNGRPFQSTGSAFISATSRKMVSDLARHGITERKTWTVEPWQGPPELQRHYWRGVFDGDGALFYLPRKRPQAVAALVGNEAMMTGFKAFVTANTDRLLTPGRPANDGESGCLHSFVPEGCNGTMFEAKWTGNIVAKQVCKLLYEGASVSLRRKQILAESIMAQQSPQRFRGVTAEQLREWLSEHGTVANVERNLGTYPGAMTYHYRKLRAQPADAIGSA